MFLTPKNTKLLLIILIALSALADIFTFFYSGLFRFETNPIYILTKSVTILLIVKILLVGLLCYIIYSHKPQRRYIWNYIHIFAGIFIIIGQLFGAYSNISTTQAYQEDPVNTIPMESEQALKSYSLFGLLFYIFPLVISTIAFWFFEKIHLKEVGK